MNYQGCLLAVQDINASKLFYEQVLHQRAVMDIGEHVAFEGFSLQQGYAQLAGVSAACLQRPPHDFQLYFEVEDLDSTLIELKGYAQLKWIHEVREYPWGQLDLRVYDPDNHIVEIAEAMDAVIRRFLKLGMSAEDVAARTMYPIELIKQ